MKNLSLLTAFLFSSSLVFAEVEISPATDSFIQPNHAEIPCLTGITTKQNGQGTIQYNTYFSPLLAVHPNNPNMLFCAMNQDLLVQMSDAGITLPRQQAVASAYSTTGGRSWVTGNIPLHLCLDGDLSNGQSVTALQYSPLGGALGTIFLAGRFSDMKNDKNHNTYSGIWTTKSTDGGITWEKKTLVSVQNSDAYIDFEGVADGTPDLVYDPHSLNNLYVAWDRPAYGVVQDFANNLPINGNIFFSRSNDAGMFWTQPIEIYDITQDIPRGGSKGGQCTGVSLLAAVKKGMTKALLCSFMRYFTKPNADSLDKTIATTFTDRVVIRSTDGGKTWSRHAIQVSPFVYAQSYNPTLPQPAQWTFPAPDGSEKAHMAVNPVSGRVYLMWQAGSLSVQDPKLASKHPEIVAAVSYKAGREWSPPVTVSKTPKSLLIDNPAAYQAFNGNIVFIGEDLVGFVYYDYRQYEKGSAVASTDAWLAVYKETEDHHAGSTHIGLDFVGEIRITNPSFDAGIATNNSVYDLMTGLGNSLGVASKDRSVFVAYPFTKAGQDSSANIKLVSVTQEPNSTYEATVDTNRRLTVKFQELLVGP